MTPDPAPHARGPRRPVLAIGLLAPLMLLATACQDFDFEQQWEIRKLRTVALIASPPELGPGESLTLRAVSYSPRGPVTHTWELCLLPGAPADGYPCTVPEGVEDLPPLDLGEGETVTLQNPLTAEQIDGFCAQVLAATGSPCALGLPVTLRVVARDGASEHVSLRPLLLLTAEAAAREDRNRNPRPLALTWNGQVLPAESTATVPRPAPDAEVLLQLIVDPADAQAFADPRSGEAREETLTAAWYTTAGELEFGRTFFGPRAPLGELQRNVLRSTPDRLLPDGEELRLIAVLRDNRGGVGVLQRTVRLSEGASPD